MNREIARFARNLDALEEPSAWDAPTGPGDIGLDEISDQTLRLGPGGLCAIGAAMNRRSLPAIYRLSVRAASRAAGSGDRARCQAALAAAIVAEWDEYEPRELMVNVAPHHVAATRVTGSASTLFDWAAEQAGPSIAPTLRAFGVRTDVTLEAFAWKEVTNPSGTWFVTNW